MTEKDVRICLVGGGHLTPALATAEALVNKKAELVFVGRKTTDIYGSIAKEEQEVSKLNLKFVAIDAPKFHRKPLSNNLSEISKWFKVFHEASGLIDDFNPQVVACFGGYVSLPIALVARMKKIPVVVHEQTTVMGRANQAISYISQAIAVSWPKTRKSPEKATLTGNPIRKAIIKTQKKPAFISRTEKPLIYITGGNQGSLAINTHILDILAALTTQYQVIHQTGDSRDKADYRQSILRKKKLSRSQQDNYHPQPWFDENEVGWLLQNADLVIGRAGANSITELLVNKTRSILIPLPISGQNEQLHNAITAQNLGVATVLEQKDLHKLTQVIQKTLETKATLSESGEKLRQIQIQAAESLATLILSCAKENRK